jgi:hypothetical protein
MANGGRFVAAYMAFLRTHPRRERLQRARFDQGEGRGPVWYISDSGRFEADDRASVHDRPYGCTSRDMAGTRRR